MTDIAARKDALLARRTELTGEIARIEDQLDDPAPPDWEDRASERQGDEVLESLGTHDLAEIRAIDAALARIEDGSYGTCVACGKAISPERLDAVPTAARCRNCA
ncbi:TraR/DksA family transcriptional regulator [Jannaschia aquimarina]|uniref:DksA_1 protein n=1 Tax=Jannaschia aquimarina TaxID=935700 RepID=A0A0D1CNQ8_9RHOB|nr:TraR/DksA C4-type zinc finger protein [Jannaschia aquimarina]KIT16332.1 RNA polymerase-binding transcription factor DksA [Jannaschia aquimarina]SNT26046.1 transcriptional regulator, TraR/DksA family [Jannaschia aquimarina]